MTLDCRPLWSDRFVATKGHFCSFLLSNIYWLTSLSAVSDVFPIFLSDSIFFYDFLYSHALFSELLLNVGFWIVIRLYFVHIPLLKLWTFRFLPVHWYHPFCLYSNIFPLFCNPGCLPKFPSESWIKHRFFRKTQIFRCIFLWLLL